MFKFADMERNEFNERLDGMLDDALHQPPGYFIPDSFTDELVKKLEKHLAWKELLSEFGLKAGLVILALVVMAVALIFPAKTNPAPFIQWLALNRFMVAGVVGVALFTFVFDQLILKYFFKRSDRAL